MPSQLSLAFDPRLGNYLSLFGKQADSDRLLRAWSWKTGPGREVPLIACLIGGTGTGKSTIFNSLVGEVVSSVGVRRPSTLKPVVFIHECAVKGFAGCPLFDQRGEAALHEDRDVVISVHSRPDMAGLILVDAPDYDSVELSNRLLSETFFVLSDIIVFVTSQEKYGDLAGQQVRQKALRWDKKLFFVMNKVVSETAFEDFLNALGEEGFTRAGIIRVERTGHSPEFIDGIRPRPEFRELFAIAGRGEQGEQIRVAETEKLRSQAADLLHDLDQALDAELERVLAVNSEISHILEGVWQQMVHRLGAVIPTDIEGRVQTRLRELLRKYDIFFTPRMIVRNAFKKAYGMVSDLLSHYFGSSRPGLGEHDIISQDLEAARSMVNLEPLEAAIQRLNLEVAHLLASDPSLQDLLIVARNGVERLGHAEIRSKFDEAFPGVEALLESELDRFREGLSRLDELKLYGSYTVLALAVVTVEIVIGGGFSLLDAVLDSVLVPLIPERLLGLKVLNLLREIGERVDQEYHGILRNILERQADIYTSRLRGLLPDNDALARLAAAREAVSG